VKMWTSDWARLLDEVNSCLLNRGPRPTGAESHCPGYYPGYYPAAIIKAKNVYEMLGHYSHFLSNRSRVSGIKLTSWVG
jgi:hypothetical protein